MIMIRVLLPLRERVVGRGPANDILVSVVDGLTVRFYDTFTWFISSTDGLATVRQPTFQT